MSPLLFFVAFATGASVMIIELVGSRLVAPYVGTSIFVWTSLIGFVLAALSFGYMLGGRLADTHANLKTLSHILFASSITTAGIIILRFFGTELSLLSGSFNVLAIMISGAIFVPSAIFLGMVTPYVARLQIQDITRAGTTLGNLYAISTAGSIVGTFAGGFVLVSFFSSTKIILGVALILLFLALIISIHAKQHSHGPILLTIIAITTILYGIIVPSQAPIKGSLVYDGETPYHRIWIYDGIEQMTGRPVRYFTDTIYGAHSGIRLDNPKEILFGYLTFFELADFFKPHYTKALMLGGAVQTYPSYLITKNKHVSIDSIEIDPSLLDISRRYFMYTDSPRITPIHKDARVFINTATSTYDVIFVDVFSSMLTVPFHITTKEAVSSISRLAGEHGIVLINIISSVEGPGSDFFRSMYTTYASEFDTIKIFRTSPNKDPRRITNLVLLATHNKNLPAFPKETTDLLILQAKRSEYTDVPPPGLLLTDEFAPVERQVTTAFING